MDPPTYPFEETPFMNGPLGTTRLFIFVKSSHLNNYNYCTMIRLFSTYMALLQTARLFDFQKISSYTVIMAKCLLETL